MARFSHRRHPPLGLHGDATATARPEVAKLID